MKESSKSGYKSVTLRELAEKTGLSVATISRAISGRGYVSNENRELIYAAQKELQYKPRKYPKGNDGKNVDLIMLCLPDNNNPFYFGFISSVQAICKHNHSLPLLSFYEKDEDEEIRILEAIDNHFVKGIIHITLSPDSHLFGTLEKLGIPVVVCSYCTLSHAYKEKCFDYIAVDTKKGIYLATRHLISQGFKKISYIGMSQNSLTGIARFSGFEAAMKEYGLEVNHNLVRFGDDYEKLGHDAMLYFSKMKNMPEAICAANDSIVLGVYRACEELGIRIPRDLCIIGMDNTDLSSRVTPKISSVDISPYELGKIAATMVFSRMREGNGLYQNMILDPRVEIRNSSVRP